MYVSSCAVNWIHLLWKPDARGVTKSRPCERIESNYKFKYWVAPPISVLKLYEASEKTERGWGSAGIR